MTTLTPELIVDGLEPSEPQVSPDGRLVAFVVGPHGRREEHAASAIWLAPSDGSAPARRLTWGTAEDREPRWSPDSRTLYFLSDRAGRNERDDLYRLPLAGGEAEPLTDWDAKIAVSLPLPDGSTVALLAPDPKGEEERRRERDRDDADVFGERWRPHRLRLLDLASRSIRTIEQLRERHVAQVVVAPAGDRLAVVTWPTPELDNSLRDADLRVIETATGAILQSWPLISGASRIAWDQHGDRIFYLAHRRPDWRGALALYTVALGSPAAVRVGGDLTGCPTALWVGPASQPAVLVADGLDTWLGIVDAENGETRRARSFEGTAWGLHASADGSTIALLWSHDTQPTDVWTIGEGKEATRISHLRPELDGIAWATQERLRWAAPDGLTIEGLLLRPLDPERRPGPLPLVTLVHGGPYHRYADALQLGWHDWGQWLATAGYAVLLPNPRGGLGRGDAFADTVAGAVGQEDWGDILAGIDHLIAAGIADPERLGIGGWSQGGFMTAWAVGQTDRFRFGIMGAGVSDWGMMVAESDLPHFEAMLGGSTGWEGIGPHRHDALSPVSFVHRVRTPVLILHGEADERVPVSQGRFFARGLREYGVPFELVVYPREPHAIRERAHQIDLLRRVRAWTERWLGPGRREPRRHTESASRLAVPSASSS